MTSIRVTQLKPTHAPAYRALMLGAYAEEPEAFTATVPERLRLPLAWWEGRISDRVGARKQVFGAFVDDRLIGVAGLRRERREREQHKAKLFGLYVERDFTGRGIGRALIGVVLDHARADAKIRVVQLSVTDTNQRATRLYTSCGFQPFGVEPLANRVGDRFIAKVHMWCEVGA